VIAKKNPPSGRKKSRNQQAGRRKRMGSSIEPGVLEGLGSRGTGRGGICEQLQHKVAGRIGHAVPLW